MPRDTSPASKLEHTDQESWLRGTPTMSEICGQDKR